MVRKKVGEKNGCSVRGGKRASKWGEVHVFLFLYTKSIGYIATEQFCMPVEACDG